MVSNNEGQSRQVKLFSYLVRGCSEEKQRAKEFTEHISQLFNECREHEYFPTNFVICDPKNADYEAKVEEFVKSLAFKEKVLMFSITFMQAFNDLQLKRMAQKEVTVVFTYYHNEVNGFKLKEVPIITYLKLRKKRQLPKYDYFPIALIPDEKVL